MLAKLPGFVGQAFRITLVVPRGGILRQIRSFFQRHDGLVQFALLCGGLFLEERLEWKKVSYAAAKLRRGRSMFVQWAAALRARKPSQVFLAVVTHNVNAIRHFGYLTSVREPRQERRDVIHFRYVVHRDIL